MKASAGRRSLRTLLLSLTIGFTALFVYSSLNLKNIDNGYRLQELTQRDKVLREEIDRLRALRAQLLNPERVERIAVRELGLAYPAAGQVIRLAEEAHARR